MIITLCGSIAFIDEMYRLKIDLEVLGHKVLLPPNEVPGETGELIPASVYYSQKKALQKQDDAWIWQGHTQRIIDHFDKVSKADAVLVANYDKNNIANYIGPNTLIEMGLAFYLKKKIYLLNPIPDIAWKEEVVGLKPVVIFGQLSNINPNSNINIK